MHWRELTSEQKTSLLERTKTIAIPQAQMRLDLEEAATHTRYSRIHKVRGYQCAFFAYPNHVELSRDMITCTSRRVIDEIVSNARDVKITAFESNEDWFAYYGDVNQGPS